MTDKKTDDDDFALNHLDETNVYGNSDNKQHANDTTMPIIDEPLARDPHISTSGQESDLSLRLANKDKYSMPPIPERQEPTFGAHAASTAHQLDDVETDAVDHDEMTAVKDEEAETATDRSKPVVNPDMSHMYQPVKHTGEKSAAQRLPIILAILAMLLSMLALALNKGGSNHDNPVPDLNTSARIQTLEQQLSAQEQSGIQQKQTFESQLSQLQDQLTSLTRQITTFETKQTHAQPTSTIKPTMPAAHARKRVLAPAPVNRHGGWVINIVSLNSHAAATREQSILQQRGIQTTVTKISIRGKVWYRLRTPGFSSEEKATAYNRKLAAKYGIKDAWIQKL